MILSTITNAEAMAAVFGGLRPHGTLLAVGGDMDPVAVPAAAFIGGATGLRGHASGTALDSEDTLAFSSLQGVKPMIETLPLERAGEGYEKMVSGDARLRMVLTTA